jgi:hypothetical protein
MKFDNTKKAMDVWANNVILDAKRNLVQNKKVSSGQLLDSLKSTGVKFGANSMELNISMAYYGTFVDAGVNGTKTVYNTPYSYKDKMPPPSALDKWIVRKNIAPRDDKGRFQSRKSIQFAIAKSIFYYGFKPTYFLRNAVTKNITKLPQQIKEAFAFDIDSAVNLIVKSNFK